MIGFVAVDGVLRQRALSPGINASHTVYVEINIEIDEAATLYLIGMLGGFEIFLTIIPSTDAEWLKTADEEEPSPIPLQYNPQNEMFAGFQTKSIFPQNEKSAWFLI